MWTIIYVCWFICIFMCTFVFSVNLIILRYPSCDKRPATFATSWWRWMPPAIFCFIAPCPTNTAKRWSSSFLAVVIERRTVKTQFPRHIYRATEPARRAESASTIINHRPASVADVAEHRAAEAVAACVIERIRRPATECHAPLQRTDLPFRQLTMRISRRKWRDSNWKRSSWPPMTSIRITIDRWVYMYIHVCGSRRMMMRVVICEWFGMG